MRLMEKILVAVDFDESSRRAVQMASVLGKAFGSEVVLFHVEAELGEFEVERAHLKRAAEEKLSEYRSEMGNAGVENVSTELVEGDPLEEICKAASEKSANVVMIGNGDKAEDARHKLGTTAGKLVRTCEKPVWIVKKNSPAQITRILCPIDFSDTSARALKNAIYLAREFYAELVVLHVIQHFRYVWRLSDAANLKAHEDWFRFQRENMDKFLQRFDFHNIKWRKEVWDGEPPDQILSAIRDTGSDLVVMGSTGKRGIARLVMGSTTEKVTRIMPASIITMKQEQFVTVELAREIENIERHHQLGQEYLEKGLYEQAADEFSICLNLDMMYAPAWEGLAEAKEKMKLPQDASYAREKAQKIRETIWKLPPQKSH